MLWKKYSILEVCRKGKVRLHENQKKKKKTKTNKQKLLRATEEFSKPETSTLEPEKLKKPWGMISPTGRT